MPVLRVHDRGLDPRARRATGAIAIRIILVRRGGDPVAGDGARQAIVLLFQRCGVVTVDPAWPDSAHKPVLDKGAIVTPRRGLYGERDDAFAFQIVQIPRPQRKRSIGPRIQPESAAELSH
jgi:hypothetical protein